MVIVNTHFSLTTRCLSIPALWGPEGADAGTYFRAGVVHPRHFYEARCQSWPVSIKEESKKKVLSVRVLHPLLLDALMCLKQSDHFSIVCGVLGAVLGT